MSEEPRPDDLPINDSQQGEPQENQPQNSEQEKAEFEDLLEFLNTKRGFDFTGYKRPSLLRRVRKRMQNVRVDRYPAYKEYLDAYPDEFAQLFNTILINVTSFFRDPSTWDYIAQEIIPRILSQRNANEPVRIWSAGCASGEEAYTIAMLFAEALGRDGYRQRVKIYATDIDEHALTHARHAVYTEHDVATVPPEMMARYFTQTDGQYFFDKELRRSVIFGRHDLITDSPISRVDLLICRNTLMYFNAEIQRRVMHRFHFALSDVGFMVLGKAEMLFGNSSLFSPVDIGRRVFTRIRTTSLRDRLPLPLQEISRETGHSMKHDDQAIEVFFNSSSIAQIIIDCNGRLSQINDRARALFNLTAQDIGRPLQDLEISYRPVELRSLIEEVYSGRRTVLRHNVAWVQNDHSVVTLNIELLPLEHFSGTILGVGVTFRDVTHYRRLQEELEQSNRQLETAYEELQSTNEELETTNEELQSSAEELQTTNEELQSTNEELETMNEELQSANEELQTMNEQLRQRTQDVNYVNTFMDSILNSLDGGVVVLDKELHVLVWNNKSEDLWGLRADEVVSRNYLGLDIGLAIEELRPLLVTAVNTGVPCQEVRIDATNRRGKPIKCRVFCTPLITHGEVNGAILFVEEICDTPS